MRDATHDLVVLDRDHPGFRDPVYRARRNQIAALALAHRPGEPYPEVDYTEEEHRVWEIILENLAPLHRRLACRPFLPAWERLGFTPTRLPRFADVNAVLQAATGFQLQPVAGLVSPRVFLEKLGEGVFCATQYLRHPSTPLYTPEPDLVHEFIGHAVLLADPGLAKLQRLFGAAARAADDALIEQLIHVYWYTIEFGLVREDGALRVLGAGLLSSAGEMTRVERGEAELVPFELGRVRATPYDPTQYQPALFVAESLEAVVSSLSTWLGDLARGAGR